MDGNKPDVNVLGDKNPVSAIREFIELSLETMPASKIAEAVSKFKIPTEYMDDIIQLLEEYGIAEEEISELEKDFDAEMSNYDSKALYTQYNPNPKKFTLEEEIELVKRAKNGDSEAEKELTEQNIRLVISIARKYKGVSMSQDDLIQEGIIGLMLCIPKFDCDRGTRFGTHATWWIRQAILRSLSNQDRVIRLPVHMCEQISKMAKAKKALQAELQRDPTVEELAKKLKWSVKRTWERMQYGMETLSLEMPVTDEDNKEGNLACYIEDTNFEPAQVVVERNELVQRILEMINTLPTREGIVVRMRYGLGEYKQPLTLEEAAEILNVTKERVRQIENRAVKRLGEQPRKAMLYGYIDNDYVDDPYAV